MKLLKRLMIVVLLLGVAAPVLTFATGCEAEGKVGDPD